MVKLHAFVMIAWMGLVAFPASGYTRFSIQGRLLDCEWASTKNLFGILYSDRSEAFFLSIYDASAERLLKTIELGQYDFLEVDGFDWLPDDSGFVLGVRQIAQGLDYPEWIKLDLATGKTSSLRKDDSWDWSGGIVMQAGSPYYGGTRTGIEEFGEIMVFDWNHNQVFTFIEYGHASLIAIRMSKIYIYTVYPLDKYGVLSVRQQMLSLSWRDIPMELISRDPVKYPGGIEDFFGPATVYEIDLETRLIKKTDIFHRNLTNTSFNGNNYYKIEQQEGRPWNDPVIQVTLW